MKKYILLIGIIVSQFNLAIAQDSIPTYYSNHPFPKRNFKPKFIGSNKDSIMREKTLHNAEFVFEGIIKYVSASYDTLNRGISGVEYNIVEIKKVFRGKIDSGTIVKVLFQRAANAMAGSGIPKDTIGIFFCKSSSELKKYLTRDSNYNNILILGGYNEMRSSNFNMISFVNNFCPIGLYTDFENKTGAYDFLRTVKGLNVPPYVEPLHKFPPQSKYYTKEQGDSIRSSWAEKHKAHRDSVMRAKAIQQKK